MVIDRRKTLALLFDRVVNDQCSVSSLIVESPTQVAILLRICLPTNCGKPHRDQFLIGFSSKNSPLFTGWVIRELESLRSQLASALTKLAERHCSQG